jgi:hypothetical protein
MVVSHVFVSNYSQYETYQQMFTCMDFTTGFIRTYFKGSLNKQKVKQLKFKIRGETIWYLESYHYEISSMKSFLLKRYSNKHFSLIFIMKFEYRKKD